MFLNVVPFLHELFGSGSGNININLGSGSGIGINFSLWFNFGSRLGNNNIDFGICNDSGFDDIPNFDFESGFNTEYSSAFELDSDSGVNTGI